MNLYFRSDTLALISSPEFRQALGGHGVTRGDTPELRVQFVRMSDGVIIDPFGPDYTMNFSAKEVGVFDGLPLVAVGTAVRTSTIAGTAPNEVETDVAYTFTPSFNTAELNTELNVGEGTDADHIDLNAQFEFLKDGVRTSTQRFTLRVDNDVVRETDLLPDDLPSLLGEPLGVATLDADGKVPASQLPDISKNIKVTVADQTARYALTLQQVQNGDYVFQTDTSVLYEVTDQTALNGAGGYTALATVTWGQVTGKPDLSRSFGITVDGAGTALTAGSKGFITVPYDCTITNWYLAADASGDVIFDIKRGGTSLVGTGNFPTLSTAQSGNAAVSGWTSVAVTAGDILEFEITGTPATITRVNLTIKAS